MTEFRPPVVGGVSLLVCFAVLCFTVFALLCLSTVQADARLADAAVQAVSDYYAADCEAQAILARLRQGEMPEGVSREGVIYTYSRAVSDRQNLEVEVRLENGAFRILRWQAVPASVWEPDEGLEIWDGSLL